MQCRKTLTEPTVDLFCGNFCSRRGDFAACYSAWCAGCYRDKGIVEFPRVVPVDEEGVEEEEVDEEVKEEEVKEEEEGKEK